MTINTVSNTVSRESQEISWRAVSRTRTMLPQLEKFARQVTGKPVRLVLTHETSSSTDGEVIYLPVLYEMGKDFEHDRRFCDTRTKNGYQKCRACRVAEKQRVLLYHEISHILYGSFDAKYSDVAPILSKHHVKRPRLSKGLSEITAVQSARMVSPYLQLMLNAVEDTRVDSQMFLTRPGLKHASRMATQEILDFGVMDETGTYVSYRDFGLNAQAMAFCIVTARNVGYRDGTFDSRVTALEEDRELMKLLDGHASLASVVESYDRAVALWLRLREHGFFQEMARDEAPEPEPEPEPEPLSEDDDEDDDSSDDTESDNDEEESGDDDPEDDDSGDDESRIEGLNKPGESGSRRSSAGSDDSNVEDDLDDTDESDSAEEPEQQESGGSGEDGAPGGSDSEPSGSSSPEGYSGSPSDQREDSGSDGSSTGGADGDSDADSEADSDEPGAPGDLSGGGGTDHDDDLSTDFGSGDSGSGDSGPAGLSSGQAGNQSGESQEEGESDEDYDPYDQAEWRDEGDSHEDEPSEYARQPNKESASAPDGSSGSESKEEPGDSRDGSESGVSKAQAGYGGIAEVSDVADAGGSGEEDWRGEYAPSSPTKASEEFRTEPVSSPAERRLRDEESASFSSEPEPEPEHLPELTPAEKWAAYRDKFGTDEQLEEFIEGMLGHSDTGSPADDYHEVESVRTALDQSEHFDEASTSLGGALYLRSVDGFTWRSAYEMPEYMAASLITESEQYRVPHSQLATAAGNLRKVFEENEAARNTVDLKRGKLDARVLGRRAPMGDMRLFKKRDIPGKRDYHVVIFWDISGSNAYGSRMAQSKAAVMSQADLLARLGIPFEVYAHTGGQTPRDGDSDTPGILTSAQSFYVRAPGAHVERVIILGVKEASDPWNSQARSRLQTIPPTGFNLDGHALEFARKRAQHAKAAKKLIMYFSDGEMPAHNYNEELAVLQRELAKCASLGIAVAGVGVETDSPSRHGLPTVSFYDGADIPKVIDHIATQLAAI